MVGLVGGPVHFIYESTSSKSTVTISLLIDGDCTRSCPIVLSNSTFTEPLRVNDTVLESYGSLLAKGVLRSAHEAVTLPRSVNLYLPDN